MYINDVYPIHFLGCLNRHPALISTAQVCNSSLLTPSLILSWTFFATSMKLALSLSVRNLMNRHRPATPTVLSQRHSTIAFSNACSVSMLFWIFSQSLSGTYISPQTVWLLLSRLSLPPVQTDNWNTVPNGRSEYAVFVVTSYGSMSGEDGGNFKLSLKSMEFSSSGFHFSLFVSAMN